VIITCEKCTTKHSLFRDLSDGESRIKAIYEWTCPTCGHASLYDSDGIERYQHLKRQWWANSGGTRQYRPRLYPVHHPSVVLPSILYRVNLFFPNSSLDIGSGLFLESPSLCRQLCVFSTATKQGGSYCQRIINRPPLYVIVCSHN